MAKKLESAGICRPTSGQMVALQDCRCVPCSPQRLAPLQTITSQVQIPGPCHAQSTPKTAQKPSQELRYEEKNQMLQEPVGLEQICRNVHRAQL